MHGDSLQAFIIAVVVVDPDVLKKWATEKGLNTDNMEGLMFNQDLKKEIIDHMDAKAKENSLSSLEKIKKVHLTLNPFTVANDLITPTFKVKRNVAKRVYQVEIDKMYEEGI